MRFPVSQTAEETTPTSGQPARPQVEKRAPIAFPCSLVRGETQGFKPNRNRLFFRLVNVYSLWPRIRPDQKCRSPALDICPYNSFKTAQGRLAGWSFLTYLQCLVCKQAYPVVCSSSHSWEPCVSSRGSIDIV